MKHLLLTTIAAVLLVGCGESQPPEPPTAKAPDISIHQAAEKGNIEAVKHHLAAGVDVNVIYKGQTPLHYAAAYGHKEIIELLIAKGADVNAKISDGFHKGDTPLDNAKHKPEIVDLLRKHGGKTLYELSIWKAAFGGSIEAIKQHIAAGTDLNAKDTYGWIPLSHAAEGGHKEIAELLIAKGANVNAVDDDGFTPLDAAIDVGHPEIAELLITKGANVNAVNDDGFTPLDSAIRFDETEIADLLRKHGGKTNAELIAEGK